MKKKILAAFTLLIIFSSFMDFASPQVASAQGPIICGLVGEPCCNLAGSSPNSCKSGLQCSGGSCVTIPGVTPPAPRGSTSSSGGGDNLWCDPNLFGTGTKLNTAVGCISVLGTPEEFYGGILKWAVGIGGGIAFLLIVYAGFMIMTAAGNPERLKAGQELLTSAISGLILLVFSIFILRFIGIDILGLNKFGFGK